MSDTSNDESQITHVLNRFESNKHQNLSDHGQKLFNAINCLLDDQEQLELTQALFKYQREHNVFTLVRSCCELFDSPRKKSLMLFMRPVIPIKDRFHYDEYYKLFFPDEFSTDVKSIFSDLIPKDLLEKTLSKANEKKKLNLEKEKEKENNEYMEAIKILEKANFDLNLDIQRLMSKGDTKDSEPELNNAQTNLSIDLIRKKLLEPSTSEQIAPVKIAGFRIIDLSPNENESLGFDVCLGPTGTFIMVSYVESDSLVEKYGMKIGDELVSVNETSFKMIDLEQAIEILSTEATLRIVLQTSGFLPEQLPIDAEKNVNSLEKSSLETMFDNEWMDPFGNLTSPPSESKNKLRRLIRKVIISPKECTSFSIQVRGGIEYQLGMFISKVDPKSNIDLRIADQIIEVNEQTFSRISHIDAVRLLKKSFYNCLANNSPIRLLVRYLGKVPMLQKFKPDKTESIQEFDFSKDTDINVAQDIAPLVSCNSSRDDFSSHETLISKLNLTKQQSNMFKYCLNEYYNSRIGMNYFTYLMRLNFKKLIENQMLECLIKTGDKNNFKKILEDKSLMMQNILKDTKKDLNIRSTESLNQSAKITNEQTEIKRSKSIENIWRD